MSDADIDKAVKEAAEFEAQDKKRKEAIDAKNDADAMVFQTEKALGEVGDKIDAADKAAVEADVQALKDLLAKANTEELTDAQVAEYKEHVKTNLEDKKANEAKRAKEDAAVDKVIENAQMDIPEAMLMTQCRQMLDDFSRRMQSQGLSMDQYFQFTGMTAEKLFEQMRPDALKRIQNSLVLEAVAKAENIEISDERVEEELQKMADAYKMELDKVKSLMDDAAIDQMKDDLAIQAAVDLVRDAAKEVEAKSSIKVLANISRMSALRICNTLSGDMGPPVGDGNTHSLLPVFLLCCIRTSIASTDSGRVR